MLVYGGTALVMTAAADAWLTIPILAWFAGYVGLLRYFVPRMRERMREAPDEFFIKPSAIADELWHLYNQDRSAWSFLTELRPFAEKW